MANVKGLANGDKDKQIKEYDIHCRQFQMVDHIKNYIIVGIYATTNSFLFFLVSWKSIRNTNENKREALYKCCSVLQYEVFDRSNKHGITIQ